MDNRVKRLWIKALQSGKYEQGRNWLRDGNEYCCLGVLCDLWSKEKGVSWDEPLGTQYSFLEVQDYLPVEVMRWAGLSSNNPEVNPEVKDYEYASLADMNDTFASFSEIAEVIEERL